MPEGAREPAGATRNTSLTSPGETYNWSIRVNPGAHRGAVAPRSIHLGTLTEGGSVFRVRSYPSEFRRRVLDLVAAGRRVEDIARDLGISDQTVYSWRRQDRVDRGLEAGLTSSEHAELISARRRIRELETELAVHRKAAELLKGASLPKGSRQSR